jgi:outer membrane protein TolC
MLVLFLPFLLQDTTRLDAGAALARALERAPVAVAVAARSRAADALGRDAGRLRNPQLGVAAENLGMQRQVTGKDGLAGTEGQVTLQTVVPLGGDLGAARRGAAAHAAVVQADGAVTLAGLTSQLLAAMASHDLGHQLLTEAAAESAALDRFAAALTARVADGRSPAGEGARVRTEAVVVASQLARRRAELAAADAQLAVALGLGADTPLRISMPTSCVAPPAAGAAVDQQRAAARRSFAEALADQAAAHRVPDLVPQVGFRRTAGFSGVLVGLAVDLPLFSSGSGALASARAEVDATTAEVALADQEALVAIASARRTLQELDAAGVRYAAGWDADLAQAVTAAEARWREGQGTLAELFDARRARLAALEEHATWRGRRVATRIALARALGQPLTASLLREDCPGVPR